MAIFLALILAALPVKAAMHPIHLAITEMAYSEKDKSLQVIHKLFIDDLELHIEQEQKMRGKELRLQLNTPREHADSDALLAAYLQAHFQLKVNGKSTAGSYLGKEYDNGAVWIYVEYLNVARPKQLEVHDDLLIDLYDDQNNLINLEIGEKKGSLRFRKGYVRDVVML